MKLIQINLIMKKLDEYNSAKHSTDNYTFWNVLLKEIFFKTDLLKQTLNLVEGKNKDSFVLYCMKIPENKPKTEFGRILLNATLMCKFFSQKLT